MGGNVQDAGFKQFTAVGRITDVDLGDPPGDVWDLKGIYPFPPVALATTIVSNDIDDTAAGLGAQKIRIFGLDKDFLSVFEDVELNGTTPVLLKAQLLRVNRMEVIRAGEPLETNQGTISLSHGATVIAQIQPQVGRSQMAIFTVPDDFEKAFIAFIFASVTMPTGGESVVYSFDFKPGQAAWQAAATLAAHSDSGTNTIIPPAWIPLPRRTDIRIRHIEVSANNTDFSAGFQIVFLPRRIPQL